jgi:hypothetical protein
MAMKFLRSEKERRWDIGIITNKFLRKEVRAGREMITVVWPYRTDKTNLPRMALQFNLKEDDTTGWFSQVLDISKRGKSRQEIESGSLCGKEEEVEHLFSITVYKMERMVEE